MANNLDILDAATATKTVKTTDNASVHTPHHNIDSIVSGAIASGAVASGAIASGAVASGAFASGALASGSIASGAIAAGAIAAGATSIADNEDAASASGDRGVKMLVVQLASPTDLAGTDGDYAFLQMSGGRLWCSSTITGTVAATQSGTWNVGTVTTVTTVSTVTNLSQMGGAAISMGTGVRDAGTQRVTIATNDAVPVTFTGSTDVATQTTLASALTALQLIDDVVFAEDAAHSSGDVGVMALSVRQNTAAATSGADGDYQPLITDTNGRLHVITPGVVVDDAAFTPATTSVLMAGFEADEGSTDSVDEGDAGAARMTLDRKQIVTVQPHAAGGLSTFRSLDLDETEEEIKGSAGSIYKLRISNFSTSIRYVKLYNNVAASVTVGTTTPLDTIVVPGATSATQPTVITESYGGMGWMFDTGICAAATTALADADTGAPGANEIVLTAYYK